MSAFSLHFQSASVSGHVLRITSQDVISSGTSILSPSGKVEPGRLVSVEQLVKAKGFSNRLIDTLKSRKMETRTIYQKVWKCFSKWCTENSFKTEFSLEFLQSEADKGLSLSTLKSQISALSVYRERKLASNPWII